LFFSKDLFETYSHRWLGITLEQMREGMEHRGLFHAGRCWGLCRSKCFLFQRKMSQFNSNDCDGFDREHNRCYQKTASRGILSV